MNFLKRSYLGLIYLFLYAPILVLMVFSFNESKSMGNWTGFSLKWYQALLEDRIIMEAFYNTIIIAILSSVIATIVGTAAALAISGMKKFPKMMVMNVTYLPVLNPDIVTGVAMMLFFIFIQMQLGFTTLLLAHITFSIPYVILAVLPKIKQLNKHTMEAALDLGATPLYTYWKVILPQIKPGIVTGFLFAFTLSLDDFIISFFTTGNGVSNLAIAIYTMARRGLNPKINAILTIMFVCVMTLLVIVNLREDDGSKRNKKKKKR